MAGFRVLRDLAARHGDILTHKNIEAMIKPGKEKAFWGALQSYANFLKHADKDPDDARDEVDEYINDFILTFACCYYEGFDSKSPEMNAFMAWFMANRPDLFSGAPEGTAHALAGLAVALSGKSRGEQLALGSELLRELKAVSGSSP
jgi:hypothetical protein